MNDRFETVVQVERNPGNRAHVVSLRAQGLTIRQISERLEGSFFPTSKSTVARLLNQSLTPHQKPYRPHSITANQYWKLVSIVDEELDQDNSLTKSELVVKALKHGIKVSYSTVVQGL